MWDDFKDELEKKYKNVNFEIIEKLIDDCLETNEGCSFQEGNYFVESSVEVIGTLQSNVYVSILVGTKLIASLLYESGINNGTQLNEYGIGCEIDKPQSRIIEVFDDISIDYEAMKANAKLKGFRMSKVKADILFQNYKSKIIKAIKDENYDKYVTGGGTTKTLLYYKGIYDRYHAKGLYWVREYKEQECDVTYQ
jgi:hypothetical protein